MAALKSFKELKSMDEKALVTELKKTTRMLKISRFENAQGLLKDSSSLKKLRKYRAQIETLRMQRTLSPAS